MFNMYKCEREVIVISNRELNYFGRRKITASLREKDLNAESIRHVLLEVLPVHIQNSQDINYLNEVYRGKQDIYKKVKKYRPEINNQFVENHLLHAVDFKLGYVFDGLQYVQTINEFDVNVEEENNDLTNDMNSLNKFFKNTQKQTVSNALSKQCYIGGVAPVMVYLNKDSKNKPFELLAVNPTQVAVVYSSGFRGERLFSIEMSTRRDYEKKETILVLVATTRQHRYTYEMPYEDYTGWKKGTNFAKDAIRYVAVKKPVEEINARGDIPVFEYTLNEDRLSLVEIGLDAQNALNQLTSSSIDDLEQFVQSLTVGIDVAIDEDVWERATAQGLLLLKTAENKKGSIDILSETLDYTALQTTYDGIQNRLYTILGVPLLNISGGGGDTGQARLTDNGWLMADTKAREDENGFVKSEQALLDYLLENLRERGLIGELELSNIEIKFNRNKVDNIQSKVQSMQMMIQSGVHPMRAMEVVGIFGDSSEVYQKSLDFFGKDFYIKGTGLKQEDKQVVDTEPDTVDTKVDTDEE